MSVLDRPGTGAVFLDRDGTVSEEVGYMYDVSQYKVFEWTGKAIRRINDSGYRVVLTTNQSGVERGYFDQEVVFRVHERLQKEIARDGAHLDAVYFCPHRPETGCECRKPKPGMLYQARDALGIDLGRSYMIGDRYLDVATGHAAGARTILVLTGDGAKERERHRNAVIQPNFVASTLDAAVEIILKDS
jgi:D-glycero-D-manno-heptose 1,7-bisphosphate phosphatase